MEVIFRSSSRVCVCVALKEERLRRSAKGEGIRVAPDGASKGNGIRVKGGRPRARRGLGGRPRARRGLGGERFLLEPPVREGKTSALCFVGVRGVQHDAIGLA